MRTVEDRPRTTPNAPASGSHRWLLSIVPLGLGMLRLVVKRALARPTDLAFTLVGLVVGVSLLTAVPLYGDGMVEKALRSALVPTDGRPPLAVSIHFQESSTQPTSVDTLRRADEYFRQSAPSVVGLRVRSLVRYQAIDAHPLYDHSLKALPLIYVPGSVRQATMASLDRLEEHAVVVEGDPIPRGLSSTPEVPVAITQSAADQMHLKVGERFWYVGADLEHPEKIGIRIASIWKPRDPTNGDYWESPLPDVTYQYTLFVSEEDLNSRVLPAFPEQPPLKESTWYFVFDENSLHAPQLDSVRAGFANLEHDANQLLPDVTFSHHFDEDFAYYARESAAIRTLLLVMSVPLLAIALYYVFVSLTMVMERQRGEIALLRSRGASGAQIVAIYLVESVLTGAIALVVGLLGGVAVAQIFSKAFGFLQFAIRPPLPTSLSTEAVAYALGVIALAMASTVVPAVRAAKLSIVTYEQQVGRSAASVPGLALDLMVIAAAAYGYWTLRNGGSIVELGASGDLLIDPLLVLVPALFIGALGLLFRRVAPALAAAFVLVAQRVVGAPVLVALRQVHRSPGTYQPLVLLLVLTLGLGIYSASAARTLETNYSDRGRYSAPADLELAPYWEYDADTRTYLEPPLGAFQVPGVRAMTRAQSYTAQAGAARSPVDVQVLGIDRITFPAVSWWRRDFSPYPLGTLLNSLATSDNAIIVSPSFLSQFQVKPGDLTQLTFMPQGLLQGTDVEFRVAGVVDYFPTLYPEQGPFVVANLSYLHDQIGLGIYYLWLSVDPAVKTPPIISAIEANGIKISRIKDQRVVVNVSRLDPQRTGILGVLSVAFLASALLTVLGFFLHTLLSLQQRTQQIGVLRTIGLSRGQLIAMLLVEQSFVASLGVAAGIVFGMLASLVFVPFLQIDVDRVGTTPPFVIDPAYGEVGLVLGVLVVMILVGMSTTLWLVRRMRIHQAIQFGTRV